MPSEREPAEARGGASPPPGEPGWWIIAKVVLFVAIPLTIILLVKVVME